MASKKPPPSAFTTLRIIGEKAQKLLAKARRVRLAPPRKGAAADAGPSPVPRVTVSLSVVSVLRAALVALAIALGVLLLALLQDKIVLLLLAVFVAIILDPGVTLLRKLRIPRGFAVLIQYCIAIFLVIFLLVSLIPVLAGQLQQLGIYLNERVNAFLAAPSIQFPFLSDDVNLRLTDVLKASLAYLSIDRFTDALLQLGQTLAVPAQGSFLFAARIAGSVFDFFVNLILVLILALFMQIEKEQIIAWLRSFLPWAVRLYVDDKSEMIHWKLAQWTRGQLLLCLAVTLLVFLALVILRMPYALTLALLAGFTELIPVVGIFIAAVPAVLIGLTQQGLVWALMLACVYYVIQWCEGNLLVPLIMKRTIGLSPIVILFAMLTGISFPSIIHPVLGIMLSIPLATIIAIFMEDWRETRVKRHGIA